MGGENLRLRGFSPHGVRGNSVFLRFFCSRHVATSKGVGQAYKLNDGRRLGD